MSLGLRDVFCFSVSCLPKLYLKHLRGYNYRYLVNSIHILKTYYPVFAKTLFLVKISLYDVKAFESDPICYVKC